MGYLNGKLITFYATDGLRLKGYLALADANKATIIHIHGNFGNFYENDFIPVMAEKYTSAGFNFLCINNRGHDGIAEAYHNGKLVYIGGAIELPQECIYDIDGAIRFAKGFSPRIILQGHSFGCLRTMTYLLQAQIPPEFILLSPADTYILQLNYIHPETISDQVNRIKKEYAEKMDLMLSRTEFGIRQDGAEYYIPVSARTFLAIFDGSMVNNLRYDKPIDFHLKTRGFVYYGGKDPLWTETKAGVEDFFLQRVRDFHFCYCENGDHHFHGFESFVINEIIRWAEMPIK